MRQLKPDVVEKRKRDLLQWIIHYYIKTSRPVASSAIATESGVDLSSATIRNILSELEQEGYLHQPHASAGRVPTDKGYRFYVDYLVSIQRLAADEKQKIERQYSRHISELDTLLSETSKLLSRASHGAGLVLSTHLRQHVLKRIEIIAVSGRNGLAILVTEEGLVRHWPITLPFEATPRHLTVINRFLNENLRGCCVSEARRVVTERLRELESEFREVSDLARTLLDEMAHVVVPEALYVDGADNILVSADDFADLAEVQGLMRLLNEKRALAGLLEQEIRAEEKGAAEAGHLPGVRIGLESGIPALAGMSLVSRVYRHKGHPVGVLGILGSKRMEYSRMLGLVDYVGSLVTREMQSWTGEDEERHG
ncbi:MAG: heat-inducible transcription repressor HrcA [Elusimicrobia bacterium]|nr:heat-inducible transcription repressor HrcA [Elusimicrobiota bacterium]